MRLRPVPICMDGFNALYGRNDSRIFIFGVIDKNPERL
ncbi:hypothetical protein ACPOL_2869 [Acidisarcina polymorpha]|uniref:Uncharacterized protein n=1 Tax=Acidisarcina polymorpha TaxID=2211140 RepID=A0A2Z5FZ47_9BACT|nr:hypothetical protein ACPOL_2869 [Acidisarcina polymorpha]